MGTTAARRHHLLNPPRALNKNVFSTPNQVSSLPAKMERENSLHRLSFSPIKGLDDDDRSSDHSSFEFEWDTSDLIRDIDDHRDNTEDAPIPLISPLETAAAPLEKLIEDGKTKVESVEYLNRCETPKYAQLSEFNKSYRNFIDKADGAIESVHKQLLYPSILDGSFKDQGQALINRWQDVKSAATQRVEMLEDKHEKSQTLLSDVNAAIVWLSEHRFFDKMHSVHDNTYDGLDNETDTEKSLKKVQNEIAMLKNLVSESKAKEPVIVNLNVQLDNPSLSCDPVVREKIEELQEDWSEFSAGLNGWKTKIENDIRSSKEYESVINKAETVVVDLHRKKSESADDDEISELAQELKSLRTRVETLESLTSELQLIPTPAISETTESDDDAADLGHGFHTLKIIKDICDRELSEGRHSPVDLVTTDEDDEETLSNDVGTETLANFESEVVDQIEEVENAVPNRKRRLKVFCATLLLSYPAYAYLVPFLAFLYSIVHCQAPNARDCPLERLRHPEFHLTWPNGPPPC